MNIYISGTFLKYYQQKTPDTPESLDLNIYKGEYPHTYTMIIHLSTII